MDYKNYPYIKNDILNNKVSYSYSEYSGMDFINNWRDIRFGYIAQFKSINKIDNSNLLNHLLKISTENSSSDKIFDFWILSLIENKAVDPKINLLLKRFEVTKKIFRNYDIDFRPIDKLDFQNLKLYLKFGCVLSLSYYRSNKIQYLNTLLKLNDILCSMFEHLNENEKGITILLLENEIEFVEKIIQKLNIQVVL